MADVDVTRVAGNIGAMNSLNSLSTINKQLALHQTRLSTGKRINSAADDPAGMTIATKMQSRSQGLGTALDNIGDAKNLLAVTESGLGRINDILVQMRNKAEQGASDTMGEDERGAITTQLKAFAAQIDDIVDQTKWNDTNLLKIASGDTRTEFQFQTGADKGDTTKMTRITGIDAASLGVASKLANSTATNADGTAFTATTQVSGVAAAGSTYTTTANLSELESGDYQVAVSVDTTAKTATVQLFDSNGKVMNIDDGAGNQALSRVVDFDAPSADVDVDLGNGLTVTLDKDAPTTTDPVETNVTYGKKGDYNITDGSVTGFADYLDDVKGALSNISGKMADIGALTGRLSFKEDQVSDAKINIEAAYNRIMNADMAQEQVDSSKYQILQQTSTAMLAQANAAPQFLLSLFK